MANKIFYLNLFTMIFIALNLRAPITSISPLVEEISLLFELNSALIGILTSLPLIAFGVFSFFVSKFNAGMAMLFGILCILFGEIVRSYGYIIDYKITGLFVGTTIMGIGIAIANVLLPIFVKSKFPKHTTQMMGLYSLILNLSAIIGVAFAIPLFHIFGLFNAMAFWAFIAIFALLFYLPHISNGRLNRRTQPILQSKSINLIKNKTAWKVTLFMGIQSFMFYGTIAWMPKIIVQKGYDINTGTTITLFGQCIATIGALLIPMYLSKIRNKYKQPYIMFFCSLYSLGYLLLFFINDKILLYFVAFVFGVPQGGIFSIALLFILQKSSSVAISTKLSSLSQGGGYLIASIAPFLMGFLYDIFGNFNVAIILFIIFGLVLSFLGLLTYNADKI